MFDKNNCNYLECANRVGLFLTILFVICFAWYYIHPVEQELHLKLFQISYFGFSGMNFISFIFGAIQTYIWGYIAVGVGWLVGCRCPRK
jgi:hypothetical protein